MQEIITVQVGQCGNQLGSQFWELIAYEHGINPWGYFEGRSDLQLQKLGVYFNITSKKKNIPRTVMVDMEPSVLDCILCCSHKDFFNPDYVISGAQGSGSNWAKGHLTDGVKLVEATLELIRKLAEECENIQGFQMIHSLGGGTGSGLGCLLTNRIKEIFNNKIMCNFTIYPSEKISDVVVEPYNAALSIRQLKENSDITFVLDNEALHDICSNALQVEEPTYGDLNQLICPCMSGITASLRFPGQLNTDLRKLSVNMTPYPSLHFLVCSYAPLSQSKFDFNTKTVQSIFQQLFNPKHLMASCDTTKGKFISTSILFRGIVSTKEVEEEMVNMQTKLNDKFVDWIPSNISSSVCDIAPPCCCLCATFIGNTTSVKEVFDRIRNNFSVMFEQKAYVHWYTDEGMTEEQFNDALSHLDLIIKEYENYNNGT